MSVQVKLQFQQSALLLELEQLKLLFDEALLRLHHEKTELDCTTISASLRSVPLIHMAAHICTQHNTQSINVLTSTNVALWP